MASWNWPALINKIAGDVPFIQKALIALLKMDPTGINDTPVGAKRLYQVSTGVYQLQQYTGSSWVSCGKLAMDADTLDSYHAAVTPQKSTVAVRNSNGLLEDSITGNAATATSAVTLSEILPISLGGTGANNSAQARANIGAPSVNHASSNNVYGLSSDTLYGHAMAGSSIPVADTQGGSAGSDNTHFAKQDHSHPMNLATNTVFGSVQLSDSINGSRGASSHVAASEKAVGDAVKGATKTMTGSSASSSGTAGTVPAPPAGSQGKPLRGDGTWASSLDCNISGTAATATNCPNYLPLLGGLLSGLLKFPVGALTYNESAKCFYINSFGGGNGDAAGSQILLFTSGASTPGRVLIRSSGESKGLDMYQDNRITWDGKNLVRSINGVTADNAGNVTLSTGLTLSTNTIAIWDSTDNLTVPDGGTWCVLYFQWGTDYGYPHIDFVSGGTVIQRERIRLTALCIKVA